MVRKREVFGYFWHLLFKACCLDKKIFIHRHEGSSLTNYTHYYNPKRTNGFIETRLKTMRTNGPAKKPKSNRRLDDELTADREDLTFHEDEDKFKIEWMKIHLSEPGSNEATIKEHMASYTSKRLQTVLLMFYYSNLQLSHLSAPLCSLLSVTCTFHAACCLQHIESLSPLDSFSQNFIDKGGMVAKVVLTTLAQMNEKLSVLEKNMAKPVADVLEDEDDDLAFLPVSMITRLGKRNTKNSQRGISSNKDFREMEISAFESETKTFLKNSKATYDRKANAPGKDGEDSKDTTENY
ncbi:hypothetical protein OUZ56_011369 [Daphnia magna]|uniref:Uncharacterized protein n=1 Tax=Daphnia magna TaxID=35525 RepID=A0ABQ9YZW5_9CRUS|nr:hypothetical protein OUZ56_011369 [Daphnia magna]